MDINHKRLSYPRSCSWITRGPAHRSPMFIGGPIDRNAPRCAFMIRLHLNGHPRTSSRKRQCRGHANGSPAMRGGWQPEFGAVVAVIRPADRSRHAK